MHSVNCRVLDLCCFMSRHLALLLNFAQKFYYLGDYIFLDGKREVACVQILIKVRCLAPTCACSQPNKLSLKLIDLEASWAPN